MYYFHLKKCRYYGISIYRLFSNNLQIFWGIRDGNRSIFERILWTITHVPRIYLRTTESKRDLSKKKKWTNGIDKYFQAGVVHPRRQQLPLTGPLERALPLRFRKYHGVCITAVAFFCGWQRAKVSGRRPATPDINFVLFHLQLDTAAYKYTTMFMKLQNKNQHSFLCNNIQTFEAIIKTIILRESSLRKDFFLGSLNRETHYPGEDFFYNKRL